MSRRVLVLWAICGLALSGCGRDQQANTDAPAEEQPQSAPAAPQSDVPPRPSEEVTAETAAPAATPAETISETEDGQAAEESASGVQPSMRVSPAPSGPPTSSRFKEGTHYRKVVPAQPTSVSPGQVEVTEVFWYGCAHCYRLDPAIESWNAKKPDYIRFVRVPAMWNETVRLHARLFYTVEALGKLEQLHPLIFREIHVNGNMLNTVEKITAFLRPHGISGEEFQKTFSSFGVESKLQRADMLNRRYRIESVPTFVVQGKYATGESDAGSESSLFALLNELAAHEAGR